VNPRAVFWALSGDPVTRSRVTRRGLVDPDTWAGVTRCSSRRLRVTQSLVPVDPVGLSLPFYCSSSLVVAPALLPSLSSFVPKALREVCLCSHLFVCDPQSSHSLPPLWSPIWSFNWYQSRLQICVTLTSLGSIGRQRKGRFCLRI
jgi:hypothetical protein